MADRQPARQAREVRLDACSKPHRSMSLTTLRTGRNGMSHRPLPGSSSLSLNRQTGPESSRRDCGALLASHEAGDHQP
jgi:hypothetical protein